MLDLFAYGDAGWGDELLAGLGITLQLAILALPLGLVLGFVFSTMSLANSGSLRLVARLYTTTMRGLPEILTLFVIYNGIGVLLNLIMRAIGADPIDFSPMVAGIVALGMVFGAFAAEVLRGAFQSLDPGQTEAAQAVGMSKAQIFRRVKVPQIWRFALPGLGNLWINLLKDTALVSVIALDDLMRMTKVAAGFTKLPFNFYLAACLIYWVLCLASEFGLAKMEKRANVGIRRVNG